VSVHSAVVQKNERQAVERGSGYIVVATPIGWGPGSASTIAPHIAAIRRAITHGGIPTGANGSILASQPCRTVFAGRAAGPQHDWFGEVKTRDSEYTLVTKKNRDNGAAESKRVRVAIAQIRSRLTWTSEPSLKKALRSYPAGGQAGCRARCVWRDLAAGLSRLARCLSGRGIVGENASAKEVFARLRSNSDHPFRRRGCMALSEAARDLKIAIVMGTSERVDDGPGNGTLYNSLLTISEDGPAQRNHHRKLVPTYTERLVWGNGDGRGLEAGPRPSDA